MKVIPFCITAILFASLAAAAPPEIASGGIMNRASQARAGALNAGIAQGSLFVIRGRGLGPAEAVQATEPPLLTQLGETAVKVAVGAARIDAFVLSAEDGQVVALLPSATPTGAATATVTYQGQTSAAERFMVVRRNFGAFSVNDSGTGPALAHLYNADVPSSFMATQDQPAVTLVRPATPGQAVTIWGTGLGAISGEGSGPVSVPIQAGITVYVGGVPATIVYSGRSSCCAGVDQIVFNVPQEASGCYVPVHVVGGGLLSTRENATIPLDQTVSNSVTISVSADGSPCTDGTGLSGTQLMSLQKAGSAKVAAIGFTRRAATLEEATRDTATARFGQFNLDRFLRSRGIFGLPAKNSCVQYQLALSELESADPAWNSTLDAGPSLVVSGGNGTREIARQDDGTYAAYLGGRNPGGVSEPSYLASGSYTVSAPGGVDVPAFEAKFLVPDAPTWTNRSPAALANSFSPNFAWRGAESADYVVAAAFGRNDLTGFYTLCAADPAAGSFTIPRYTYAGVVQHTSAAPGVVWIAFGKLTQFDAPGLDFGFVNVMIGTDPVFIP